MGRRAARRAREPPRLLRSSTRRPRASIRELTCRFPPGSGRYRSIRERVWESSRRSLLDTPGREARLPVALEVEEGDDERYDGHQRTRDDRRKESLGAAAALARRLELCEADCQREQLRVRQHDERQEVVVPRRDEREQEHGDDARTEEPQRHLEEDPVLAGTVDPGGL